MAQGYIEDTLFAFNIGTGFGDTSQASENMLFHAGKAHKIEEVNWHIPKDEKGNYDYLAPWRFTSSDERLEMVFTPILDRTDQMNLGLIMTNQHQVFGHFQGKAVLADGKEIAFQKLFGFAEVIKNRW